MKIGKAVGIFTNIESGDYTVEEKGEAIMQVCKMPTHNGIGKDYMLKVIWWLLTLAFDLPEDECEHDFTYNEQIGEFACVKCGHLLTKEEKRYALEYAMTLMRADEGGGIDGGGL